MTMTRLQDLDDEPRLFDIEPKAKITVKKIDKAPNAFRTISEVVEELNMQQHVLRFWETKFPQIKPLKRGGGRRYYRAEDVMLLRQIHSLLYGQGYTIKGAQKILKEGRVKAAVKVVESTTATAPRAKTSGKDRELLTGLLQELKSLRALV